MSEFDWINRYLRPLVSAPGASGLSNDVAVLENTGPLIATMDTIVEGVHFLINDPIETVARKLLRVNVSDILCKGALPVDALFSCALPSDVSEHDFERFCRALGDDLGNWNVNLVGGDMVHTSGPLILTLTLTGRCLAGAPLPRSGAQPGDVLCVTGEIGHGGLGLSDAKNGRETAQAARYRVPVLPDAAIATLVADLATASIDISDGLVSDASHIAKESGTEIAIRLDKVPFAQPVSSAGDALHLATSGDDYQTLFTVPASSLGACLNAASKAGLQVSVIGTVETGIGITLSFKGEPVALPDRAGYSH